MAQDLVTMAAADQAMRNGVINGEGEWDSSIDQENEARLKDLVDKYGWPTVPKVGPEASNAAWLLVQHASDLSFMERCLELMENLAPGEVKPANIAYLKDRVLMLNNKPQIYGTQFQDIGSGLEVYPVEEMENVDQRRASVGLGSFREYEKLIKQPKKQ